MRWTRPLSLAIAAATLAGTASAQGFYNSPNGTLPAGVTAVGGLVADLVGTNGNRLVSQLAASTLFTGFNSNSTTIGTQTGFTAAQLSALGGGLSAAAFRVTLSDGDSRAGDFDFNENVLLVNGQAIQNFSAVSTTTSDGLGNNQSNTALGFGDNLLNTGFFFTNNVGTLASIFTSLSSSLSLTYVVTDVDGGDNFYDFTQGVDGGLINVGQPPVVVPPTTATPEPATIALFSTGLLALAGAARRRTRA